MEQRAQRGLQRQRSRRSSREQPNEASNANATIASLETLEGKERESLSERPSARRASVCAGARMLGRIEPLGEPFLGAWMLCDARFDGLTVGQLTTLTLALALAPTPTLTLTRWAS